VPSLCDYIAEYYKYYVWVLGKRTDDMHSTQERTD
jgi:hypothetical protein